MEGITKYPMPETLRKALYYNYWANMVLNGGEDKFKN